MQLCHMMAFLHRCPQLRTLPELVFAALCLCLSGMPAQAQTDMITLEEIWQKGTFRAASVPGFVATRDGKHYLSVAQDSMTRILITDLDGSGNAKTMWSGRFPGSQLPIENYALSTDEKRLLLYASGNPIYRRSTSYQAAVVDLATGRELFVDSGRILHATLSPDGSKVAFVKDNNLYYRDLAANRTVAVTTDGAWNAIINGNCDWVYEEEFEFSQAFQWSPDGRHLAYYRFDELRVPEFAFTTYDTAAYTKEYRYKYPKAGAPNSVVTIHTYDVQDGSRAVIAGAAEYTPRIEWVSADQLCVLRMNRHQNRLDYLLANPETGAIQTLLTETDSAYVEISDNRHFVAVQNLLFYTSEHDGFNGLYRYDWKQKRHTLLSPRGVDVDKVVKVDEKGERIYFLAAPQTVDRQLYVTSWTGKQLQALTQEAGSHDVTPAGDDLFLERFSTLTTPPVYRLLSLSGKTVRTLEDNAGLKKALSSKKLGVIKLMKLPVKAASGMASYLNGWMITPPGFNPTQKYPVLMHQYSGPGSQKVLDAFMGSDYYWHQMLAQNGYIIVCVDGTGTGFRGRDFKKATYLELGRYESDDQIAVAKYLAAQPYVDSSRIGIWGWSFGGFMSSTCIFKAPDVFKAAIAVAPVTNWRFYDNIYTERYMRTPAENAKGYDDNAPVSMAKNLKGKFLLIHGTADDNVHFQNAVVLTDELIRRNKDFDSEYYPNRNHGIYGGLTRLQLYRRMTQFILQNL
ncbi:MAG: S9 family peptidase [Sphingobacteriales bacterium]|nr:MAG: S9 family peptidase [Sphingobacteriales bacterium]